MVLLAAGVGTAVAASEPWSLRPIFGQEEGEGGLSFQEGCGVKVGVFVRLHLTTEIKTYTPIIQTIAKKTQKSSLSAQSQKWSSLGWW